MNKRVFTLEDQHAFAEFSGDDNPMHTNPVAARRTLFGRPVVHGVHGLLWGMDQWATGLDTPVRLRSLEARFRRPIFLDQEVECAWTADEPGRARITLSSSGVPAITAVVEWQPATEHAEGTATDTLPGPCSPRERTADELTTAEGEIPLTLHRETASRRLPNLFGRLAPDHIAALLASTRLVGVECPGLHSMYSELKLFGRDSESSDSLMYTDSPMYTDSLTYRVTRIERRFGLLLIDIVAGNLTGTVKAFLRPAPRRQADFDLCSQMVEEGEFAGQKALVIGGSRGLGEISAKLLAAGGGEVTVTYFRGKDDAEAVTREIVDRGAMAACLPYNVLTPDEGSFQEGAYTHVYYFATPAIGTTTRGKFSSETFDTFCRYFVTGFYRAIEPLIRSGTKAVFYPSTVFIDEVPADMSEYTAAKAAGESLCATLENTHRELTVYRPRLAKMATDQTATFMDLEDPDPAPEILKHLRAFRDVVRGGAPPVRPAH